MNKTEHLLTCIMEECAEIQQAAAKALRFGLDDGHPSGETTNAEDIVREYADLKAVIQMLANQEEIIKLESVDNLIQKKIDKVNQYMEYSKTRGALKE